MYNKKLTHLLDLAAVALTEEAARHNYENRSKHAKVLTDLAQQLHQAADHTFNVSSLELPETD